MKFLRILVPGCAAVLGVACAGQDKAEVASATVSMGPAVVREGIIYIPASVGPQGCVLYRIRIPDGQAPAAMAYQSTDGRFSYGRPDRCVKPVRAKQAPAASQSQGPAELTDQSTPDSKPDS